MKANAKVIIEKAQSLSLSRASWLCPPPPPRKDQGRKDQMPTSHPLLPNQTVNHGIDPVPPLPSHNVIASRNIGGYGRVGLPLKGFLISVWFHQPVQCLIKGTVTYKANFSHIESFSPWKFLYLTTQQIKSKGSFKLSEKECDINIAHKSVVCYTFHWTFTEEQNSFFPAFNYAIGQCIPIPNYIITTQLLPPLWLSFKYNYSFSLWQTRYKCFYSSND